MVQNILERLVNPLLAITSIMAAWAIADMLTDFLQKKKYAAAIITSILAFLLSWKIALIIILVACLQLFRKKNKQLKTDAERPKYEPSQGSTADYERWRAEQEKKKP